MEGKCYAIDVLLPPEFPNSRYPRIAMIGSVKDLKEAIRIASRIRKVFGTPAFVNDLFGDLPVLPTALSPAAR